MKPYWGKLRGLGTLRSKERRWVYMACAALFTLLAGMSILMAEDVRAATPCVLIVGLLLIQFRWPTTLLWMLLVLIVLGIGMGVILQASMLQDYVLGVLVGVVPLVLLLWARPKSVSHF